MDTKYQITVRNWDKWQRPMRGNKEGPRNWVAFATNMLHDPDVLELTIEQRWLWVAILLHTGRVGVGFKLSMSSARVLFGLRPGWRGVVDLDALKNQGFIDYGNATNKTRQTRQDKTNNIGQLALTERFEEWWKCYPKKVGKLAAQKKWRVKKLDAQADILIADAANRIANDSQWIGGYIPHPTTYLNGERWNDEISVDTTKKLSYAENLAKDMQEKGML
jgi:hypothetical protein